MDKEKKSTIIELLKTVIITVAATLCVLYFIQVSRVVGSSMQPTYHSGNIILVNKIFYKTPEHGDIVAVKYKAQEQGEQIVKRIIGLPGDTIEMKNNQLYRNGELLKEDYILEEMVGNEDFSYYIPEGKVFVMGDNRNNSKDSRMIGYVDFEKDVVGKVFFKLF